MAEFLNSQQTEALFNDFVRRQGGTLLEGSLPPTYKGKIADYWFKNEGVIAELKCLRKDFFSDSANQKKFSDLYEKWVRQSLVSPLRIGVNRIRSHDLPLPCQIELLSLVRKPVRSAVEKANAQIKATKKALNSPNHKGLLIVVNEGNRSLQSDAVMYFLSKLLGSRYSSIDHVIYLTIGLLAACPGIDKDLTVWVSSWVNKGRKINEAFLSDLADAWFRYLDELRQEKAPIIRMYAANDLSRLQFIKTRGS